MPRRSYDDLGHLQRSVMEAIWHLGEASVQQVRDDLSTEKQHAYTTILTVMQKLEKAGWLRHRADGRAYVYSPRTSREEARAGSLRRVADLVFRGDTLLMFQNLLDDHDLSDEELADIQNMIDQKRRENRNE